MFRYCSVPACGNNDLISPDDTFHFLPEDDSLRTAWIEKCHLRFKWERLDITPLIYDSEMVVCSHHFSESDYLRVQLNTGKDSCGRILKPGAIPSLDLQTGIKALKSRITEQNGRARLQLEKFSHGTKYTIQDYAMAVLQSCTFADIEGKCHSFFHEQGKLIPSKEKCQEMFANKKGLLIPSDDEKKRLTKKTGIPTAAIQNCCYYHQFTLLRNSLCCDPFKKHELGKMAFPLFEKRECVVTPSIYKKIKHVAPHAVPGEEICTNCIRIAKRSKLDPVLQQENKDIVISSQSTSNLEKTDDHLEKTTSEVDMALPSLEETPAVNGWMKVQHEFVCNIRACGLALANEPSLVDHLMRVHLNETVLPLICEFCNEAFDMKIMYNKHTLLHKKEVLPKYAPSVQKSSLREQKKDFLCCVCFQEFTSKLALTVHHKICRRSCRKNARDQSVANYLPFPSTRVFSKIGTDVAVLKKKCPYACNFCNLKFFSEPKLQEHLRVFHSGSNSSKYTPLFKCHVCNKNFSSSYYMDWHLKWHAKANRLYNGISESKIKSNPDRKVKFKCDVSDYKFEHEIDLDTHLKQAQTCQREKQSDGNSLLKCNICGGKFEREIDFNQHLKDAHTSILYASQPQSKPSAGGSWSCDLCQYIFFRLPDLNKHLAENHAVTKLFSCNVCGIRFHRCSERSQHIADLKGEHIFGRKCIADLPGRHVAKFNMYSRKPYPCDVCGKRFHKKGERLRHKADHHVGTKCTTEKPLHSEHHVRKYFCSHCGAGFRFSASLLEHSVKHVSHNLNNQPAYLVEPVMNISFLQNLLDVYVS